MSTDRVAELHTTGVTAVSIPRQRSSVPTSPEVVDTVSIDGVPICSWAEDRVVEHVITASAAGQGGLIVTPNVDIMRGIAQGRDPAILEQADLLVPDGMPLVWTSKLQGDPLAGRVTGADLFWSLSRAAAAHGRSVFVLGGAPGVGERAARALKQEAPDIVIAGVAAPDVGFEDRPASMRHLEDQLLRAQPDIVFVALGWPKQERLAMHLRLLLPRAWFLGCGGAVDMAAGDRARAPQVVQTLGLEWVHRMALEPGRLWRRYLVDDLPYVCGMLWRSLRLRFA